ncbi:MAG: hypothetical protein NZM10_02400, partial [Fimbriimonadales bacterium]|nr:hypothetical protein [Fimbriimonadales bacterium]
LNHPPSIKSLTLELNLAGRTGRWRVILPPSQRVLEPPIAYDEWVRLPEVEVRLGAQIDSSPSSGDLLVVGWWEWTVHADEPFLWEMRFTDVIPEWVSPAESSLRSEVQGGVSGVWIDHKRLKGDGVSGAGYVIPYAAHYRVCRIKGYLQKCNPQTKQPIGEAIPFDKIVPVEPKRQRRA